MRASEFAYKHDHPMDKRSAEAARIREKYVQFWQKNVCLHDGQLKEIRVAGTQTGFQ